MAINTKRYMPKCLFFALLSLADFLIYYIPRLLLAEYTAAIYISYFICRFIEFALPIMGAAVIFSEKKKFWPTVASSLKIGATRLVFLLPYYYLSYVNGVYDSIEAIALSVITSLAVVISLSVFILIGYFILTLTLKKSKKAASEEALNPFNVDSPSVLGVFLFCVLEFVIFLGFEIYDTVLFFVDAGASYRQSEIYFIIGSYVFLLLSLFLSHTLACLAANLCKKQVAPIEED